MSMSEVIGWICVALDCALWAGVIWANRQRSEAGTDQEGGE